MDAPGKELMTGLEKGTAEARPLVSVIMPVHNAEDYVGTALDSVLSQTLQELEVICVDDGSTDASPTILQEYARKDARVRVLRQAYSGPATARNAALGIARGEYVTGVDADDAIAPEAYECAVQCMTPDVDIVCFGSEIIMQDGAEPPAADARYHKIKYEGVYTPLDSVIMNTDVFFWDKLFRRSFLEEYQVRFPDGLLFEDACFFYKAMAVARDICYLDRPFYLYHRRPHSIMDQVRHQTPQAIDHLIICRDIHAFYEKHGLLPARSGLYLDLLWSYFLLSLKGVPAGMRADVEKLVQEMVAEQKLEGLAPGHPVVRGLMRSGRKPPLFAFHPHPGGRHYILRFFGFDIKIKRRVHIRRMRAAAREQEARSHAEAEARMSTYRQ